MPHPYIRVGSCLVVYLSLCAPVAAQSSMIGPWAELVNYFAECSSIHGYSQKKGRDLPENKIGAGELKWRSCAYGGIEKIMIPKSTTPDLFRQLIAEDKVLTAKIGTGDATRSHRKSRTMAIFERIKQGETNAYKAQQKQFKDQMRAFERSRNPVARRAARGWM